eukprot:CAMPEP_0172521326 /NCGR_PEP_ID=MMETSP1066-20121228/292520_1 /TAXON_ID=671091 /ORGANISM="Coscinodiscus wailesii, Strain CCMP2513" /LENGTH=45 /DNA_ID= /DNA_START= /DNA_END= /DNA_ORIENTATION=
MIQEELQRNAKKLDIVSERSQMLLAYSATRDGDKILNHPTVQEMQ